MTDAEADQCIDELFDVIERYKPTPDQLFVLGLSLAKSGFADCSQADRAVCSKAVLDIVAVAFNAGQPVFNQ